MSKTALPFSFEKAIELGEYDPAFLERFPVWSGMSRHSQYEFVHQALTNRRKQLRLQWADMANQPDFSKKPHLMEAQKKIQDAMHKLIEEEELLQVEYAGS